MKTLIPYVYEESYVHPRKHGGWKRSRMKAVEVDLPEIDDADCPIVATWTFGYRDRFSEYHTCRNVPLRHRDGVFYVRASHYGARPVSVEALSPTEGDWASSQDRHSFAHFIAREDRTHQGWVAKAMAEGATEGVVDYGINFKPLMLSHDGEAIEKKRLLELVAGLAIIDGGVWRRVDEPVLIARKINDQNTGRWKGETAVSVGLEGEASSRARLWLRETHELFRLTDGVGLSRLFLREGERWKAKPPPTDVGDIQIVDPSVFRFDRDASVLGRALATVAARYPELPEAAPPETADIHRTLVAQSALHENRGTLSIGTAAIAELLAGFLKRVPDDDRAEAVRRNLAKFDGVAADMAARPGAYAPDARLRKGLDVLAYATNVYGGSVGSMDAAAVSAFLDLRDAMKRLDGFSRLEDVLTALEEKLGGLLRLADDGTLHGAAYLMGNFGLPGWPPTALPAPDGP